MYFLRNKGFSDQEIEMIMKKYEDDLDNLDIIQDNIEDVVDYFDSYGIKNIHNIMLERIDIFYLPVEKLMEIFSHYEKDYIIKSLNDDPNIFDELK